MRYKRLAAAVLSGVLLISTVSCGKKAGETSVGNSDITLTFWSELPGTAAQLVSDMAQTELYKELEKRTGIKIKFIHPTAGNSTEQFNVMIASRDLPDMIERDWSAYPGAEMKASQDGILMDITEFVEQHAPNMVNYIDTRTPDAKKWVMTDNKYFIFPSLADYDNFVSLVGPIVRKDLLDKFNLDIPTTIADWDNMLRVFKDGGVKFPLSYRDIQIKWYYPIIGSFGSALTFFQDDGVMKYGYMEPGFRDYLKLMSGWLKEGLVDPDVVTMDGKAFDGKLLNGDIGAFFDNITSLKERQAELKKIVPEAELIGVPYPSLVEGEPCKFIHIDRRDGYTFANAVGITTANKYPVETVKWLDYAFSEEGHMLYNFGIEGVSYNMENGYPKYTELITNNPDYPMNVILANYTKPTAAGYVDQRYMEQFYALPSQQEAAAMWSANANLFEHAPTWRACYKMTVDESKEVNDTMINFNNFVTEKYTRYLTGVESLDTFDDYVAQLKSMGIERVLEIYQSAYDRIMGRD